MRSNGRAMTMMLTWCPAASCQHVVRARAGRGKQLAAPIRCDCRHVFCSAVGEDWHDDFAR